MQTLWLDRFVGTSRFVPACLQDRKFPSISQLFIKQDPRAGARPCSSGKENTGQHTQAVKQPSAQLLRHPTSQHQSKPFENRALQGNLPQQLAGPANACRAISGQAQQSCPQQRPESTCQDVPEMWPTDPTRHLTPSAMGAAVVPVGQSLSRPEDRRDQVCQNAMPQQTFDRGQRLRGPHTQGLSNRETPKSQAMQGRQQLEAETLNAPLSLQHQPGPARAGYPAQPMQEPDRAALGLGPVFDGGPLEDDGFDDWPELEPQAKRMRHCPPASSGQASDVHCSSFAGPPGASFGGPDPPPGHHTNPEQPGAGDSWLVEDSNWQRSARQPSAGLPGSVLPSSGREGRGLQPMPYPSTAAEPSNLWPPAFDGDRRGMQQFAVVGSGSGSANMQVTSFRNAAIDTENLGRAFIK